MDKQTLKRLANLPYNTLTSEEHDAILSLKGNTQSIYKQIKEALGSENSAERRDISELFDIDNDSLTVAEYWRLFEFKRQMHEILVEYMDGVTVSDKNRVIESMPLQERIEFVKKYI